MSVYVDDLRRIVARGNEARRVGARHEHQWCHMWADTLEELHEMASRIGLRRAWFQDDARLPHYDLVPGRRRQAVVLGAIEVGPSELGAAIKRNRTQER